MLKQVPHSPKLQAQIAAAYGDPNADTSTLAVFEAVAANTKPLLRKGGLFDSAVIGIDVLSAMKNALASDIHVPLGIMHGNTSEELPIGKVFASELVNTNDGPELHALFYLDGSQTDLIGRINSGTVAEVSVGITTQQMLCSQCGWDFMSDEATSENIWDCTCANGHVLGKDGVHTNLHGLAAWREMSLVDRGAVNGSKILARPQMSMGKPDPLKLAARGFDDRVLTLFASVSDTLVPTKPAPKETPAMELKELVASNTELSVKLAMLDRDKTEGATALAAAQATVATHVAKITALEAELAVAKNADATKLKVDLDLAMGLLDELGTASLGLLGKGETLPETVSARVDLVREARVKLAVVIPVNGASQGTGSGKGDEATVTNFSAFKTGR